MRESDKGALAVLGGMAALGVLGFVKLASHPDWWPSIINSSSTVLHRVFAARRVMGGLPLIYGTRIQVPGTTTLTITPANADPDEEDDSPRVLVMESVFEPVEPDVPNIVVWSESDLYIRISCPTCHADLVYRGAHPGAVRCHSCGEVFGFAPHLQLSVLEEGFVAHVQMSGYEIPETVAFEYDRGE